MFCQILKRFIYTLNFRDKCSYAYSWRYKSKKVLLYLHGLLKQVKQNSKSTVPGFKQVFLSLHNPHRDNPDEVQARNFITFIFLYTEKMQKDLFLLQK